MSLSLSCENGRPQLLQGLIVEARAATRSLSIALVATFPLAPISTSIIIGPVATMVAAAVGRARWTEAIASGRPFTARNVASLTLTIVTTVTPTTIVLLSYLGIGHLLHVDRVQFVVPTSID